MPTTASATASFGQQEIDEGVRAIVMDALAIDDSEYDSALKFTDMGASLTGMGTVPVDSLDIAFRTNKHFGLELQRVDLTTTPVDLSTTIAGLLLTAGRFIAR